MLLPDGGVVESRIRSREGEGRKKRNENNVMRKPDLASFRYQEIDVPFTRLPRTYFCVQPLYSPRILLAFRNSLLARRVSAPF